MDFMLNPFCRKFREFLFPHFGQFSGIFKNFGEGKVPAARPSSTSCLMLMMMSMRRITEMIMTKMMKMKMRMILNLRMTEDDRGCG